MNKIILASASPRRREILEKAGVNFTVIPASGEEKISTSCPEEAVQQLSSDKARSVAQSLDSSMHSVLVIGADTVVSFAGKILGKPRDEEDAVNTLESLQGNTHQVYTGVTVMERKDEIWMEHTFYEVTDVTFYPVSHEEILQYVKTKEPVDKAGSYAIQGLFGIYVKEIRGDYNNVVGLPVSRLFYEMKKLGIKLRG
ncbi:MAG: Maf family protein [Blautia sp.]|nr:Maf family protein [Blautia sp.]